MKTENFILHDSCERQQVEKLGEVFPDICISIFSLALVVESVDLCDLSAFMVSSQNGNSVFVPYFEGDKECHRLN